MKRGMKGDEGSRIDSWEKRKENEDRRSKMRGIISEDTDEKGNEGE